MNFVPRCDSFVDFFHYPIEIKEKDDDRSSL